MTEKQFVRDVRDFLGDVPERSSTSNLTWETEEILDAANAARDVLVRNLWDQKRSKEQPFQLNITSAVKVVAALNGSDLPVDYWKGLCCTNGSQYVPLETDERSSSILGLGEQGADYAEISGGIVHGAIDTLVYVALPSVPMTGADTELADFDDSFYECLELVTCISLLSKRDHATVEQMQFLAREAARGMATLT